MGQASPIRTFVTNPQIETKIERAAEAVEALALAIVAAQSTPTERALAAFEVVKDAREEFKAALREMLAPTLRVVQ